MNRPHFYLVSSRIGLKNAPIGKNAPNFGVEDGAKEVISSQFLEQFKSFQKDSYSFSKPEEIRKVKFNEVLATELEGLTDLINKSLKKGEIQVVVGGDHSITFSSLLALLRRIPRGSKVGYVQIDSHGDINLSKESPTDNFHGMYLRPFTDTFDIPEISKLVRNVRINPKHMVYFGNLDLDKKESEYFKKKGIKNFNKEGLKNKREVEEWFKKFIKGFDYLHISIDIDAFDKTIAPATGIPAEEGLLFEDIEGILKIVKTHPNFSADLAEVNPKKEGAKKTVLLAQKIINTLLI